MKSCVSLMKAVTLIKELNIALEHVAKSTVVDESFSTNSTKVLFKGKTTSLLQETTE